MKSLTALRRLLARRSGERCSSRERTEANRIANVNTATRLSGYYEWQNTTTGKQPWYFTRADGERCLTNTTASAIEWTEGGFWDNALLSTSTRDHMPQSISYWGTATSC
jgi:hypothetical protein